MQIQAIHLLISGRVQGVGYRAFTHRKAESLRLVGWVRNLPDGSVEAIAQGEKSALVALVTSLWEGPSGSKVDKVVESTVEIAPELTSFNVRR